MKSEAPESHVYRFESFVLNDIDGLRNELGACIKLQPQPLKLLSLVVSRAGDIVTREEIQKHLWNDETFVDFEHSVNFCMRQIRAALGDDAKPRDSSRRFLVRDTGSSPNMCFLEASGEVIGRTGSAFFFTIPY